MRYEDRNVSTDPREKESDRFDLFEGWRGGAVEEQWMGSKDSPT